MSGDSCVNVRVPSSGVILDVSMFVANAVDSNIGPE